MRKAVGRQRYYGQNRAAGDMILFDAVYHRACLANLYRKAETVGCDDTGINETRVIIEHVLHELIE